MFKVKREVRGLFAIVGFLVLICFTFYFFVQTNGSGAFAVDTALSFEEEPNLASNLIDENFASPVNENEVLVGADKEEAESTVVYKSLIFIDEKCNNYVYNGEPQNFVKSLSNLSGALCGINEDAMIVDGALQTNPGRYYITIRLKDGYVWEDGSNDDYDLPFSFIIKKKDLDLSEVSVSHDTYSYDGKEKKARIINEEILSQDGILDYYWADDCDGGVSPGVYETKLIIDVDERFYNTPSPILGSITINPTKLSFDDESLVMKIEINTLSGSFLLGSSLSVKNVEKGGSILLQQSALFEKYIKDNEEIVFSYDISVVNEDEEVALSSPALIKMKLPNEVKGKDFRILHIHNDNVTQVDELSYEIVGDYALVNVDSLSEFAFIVSNTNGNANLWIVILICGIAGILLILLIFYYSTYAVWKRKGVLIVPALEKLYRKTNIKFAKTSFNNVELVQNASNSVEVKEAEKQNKIKEMTEVEKEEAVAKTKKQRKKRSQPRKKTTKIRKTLQKTATNNNKKTTKTNSDIK